MKETVELPSKLMAGHNAMPNSKGARKPNNQQQGNGKKFNKFGKKNASAPGNEATTNDNPLLKEILNLGGSNDDLKLVENIDEDDTEEFETGASANDAAIANELQKFMKGMNFDKFTKESAAITTDDEEEAEEDNDEDGYEDVEEDNDHMEEEVDEEEVQAPRSNGKQGTLHIEPAPQWHTISLPALKGTPAPSRSLSDTEISARYQRATELLDQENAAAESHPSLTSSDRSFLSDILKSGTLNDKVSALTLLVQESPIHALRTMDTLMSMSKKKSRKEAVQAITSLKDLFIGSVLPDRKLIYFRDRPLWDKGIKDEHLIVWAYEDFLKKYYFEFLQTIEALSHDTLLHVRHNMVTCMHDLLAGKPEQEQNLLRLLVNKLGDSENKVAAKVSHLVIQLFQEHPAMKIFVIREIEQLLLRPNVSERAQYYAIVTVNQTILTSKDQEVANKLVDIYFVFFRRLLKVSEKKDKEEKPDEEEESHKKAKSKGKKHGKLGKKADEEPAEDENSKLIGAVITGINRAFPYSKVDDQVFENNMDILFRITHTSTFNTSIQALMLIFQVCTSKELVSDRFYRTLYESLLDPRLVHSSKQAMYMNLLFKALRADSDLKRVKAFVKRMIQIAAYHQPTFICGILYLADKLMSAQPGLRALITQPEEDDEEEHFEDAPDSDDEQPAKAKETTTVSNNNNNVYDGRKRDPRFANADKTCLWELNRFTRHYHPSVCKFAQCILKGERIETAPDLRLHTLMHFLDRFVYRNAKKKTGTKGSSIMQPFADHAGPDQAVSLQRNAVGLNRVTVNSEEFWRKKVEDVPVDELFFHKYFNQKLAGAPTTKQAKKKKEAEDESDGEEDEVWRAMVNSMPGEDGGEDLEDLDEDEDDSADDEEMQALLMDSEDDLEDDLDEAELGDQDFDDMEDMDNWEDEEDEDGAGKRKAEDDSDDQDDEAEPKKKRTKKPRLPTFASYEDYEAMLDN